MIQPSNTVILRGNLASDPEMVGNNNSIAKFRLAVSNSGNDSANQDNKTGFFDIICFLNNSQCGDFLRRMISEDKLSKGSGVEVLGSLSHSRWTQDGASRSRVEVIIEGFSYAGSRQEGGGGGNRGGSGGGQSAGGQSSGGGSQSNDKPSFRDF